MRIRVKSKQWVLENSFHYRTFGMNYRVLEVLYPERKDNEFSSEKYRVVLANELDDLCGKFGTVMRTIESGSDEKYVVVNIEGDEVKLPGIMLEEIEEEQLSLF